MRYLIILLSSFFIISCNNITTIIDTPKILDDDFYEMLNNLIIDGYGNTLIQHETSVPKYCDLKKDNPEATNFPPTMVGIYDYSDIFLMI